MYLFKNAKGVIIYVGKANILRNRVRSYFTGRDDGRYQYPKLVDSIADFDIVLTRTEVEALKTEAVMIRRHRPRFNVDLKDDRTYPYLKITREAFPRISITRKPRTADSEYFGPFTDVKPTRYLIRTLKHILQIRNCDLGLTPEKIKAGKFKVCLDYHIGRCEAPCIGEVDSQHYMKGVERFKRFLLGKHDEIIQELEAEMRQFAAQLEFEKAAECRDRLAAARKFADRQTRVAPPQTNQDAIGLVREDSFAAFSVLKIRSGRIVGKSPFYMKRADGHTDSELIESFLVRHYLLVDRIPEEILIQNELGNGEGIEEYLTQLAGRKVHLKTPQRGEKHSLLRLSQTNAEHLMLEKRISAEKRDFVPRSITALQELLGLENPPLQIEAFDISNLQGSDSVASMVMFRKGKPFKKGYRIFKIKSVEGINDFASIGEAVRRRYFRLKAEVAQEMRLQKEGNGNNEAQEKPSLPDLILIDGGKGQLKFARNSLLDLGLDDIPVLGLAKRLEEILLPDRADSIILPKTSSALRLLQQVRNEAHRFAVTKHRILRGKRQVKSKLDEIPGIGSARKQALLKEFGSLKRIGQASVERIASVKGMNQKVAKTVLEFLDKGEEAGE